MDFAKNQPKIVKLVKETHHFFTNVLLYFELFLSIKLLILLN